MYPIQGRCIKQEIFDKVAKLFSLKFVNAPFWKRYKLIGSLIEYRFDFLYFVFISHLCLPNFLYNCSIFGAITPLAQTRGFFPSPINMPEFLSLVKYSVLPLRLLREFIFPYLFFQNMQDPNYRSQAELS